MSFPFNANEIFEMAEESERNERGAFYSRAADSRNRRLLLDLAAREDEHEKIFASMRANLADGERVSTVFDPDGQAALYLRAMADGHVFNVRADPIELFTGKEAMEKILLTAMGMEKDSIAFYLGMKEIIPQRLGKKEEDRRYHQRGDGPYCNSERGTEVLEIAMRVEEETMTIEVAIKTAIECEAQVRDGYRDDTKRATDLGFPLRGKRPWGNQW